MLTEFFLNNCFSLVFSNHEKISKDKVLFRDILEIINFFKEKDSLSIPIIVKNKVDCLCKICEMKLQDKVDGNIVDSICYSEKYKQFSDFLRTKVNEVADEKVLLDNIKQVRIRKKLFSLFSNYDKISSFVDTVKNASFDSIDDIVLDYENVIKGLYINMMDNSRFVDIESSSSLDLIKDDYSSVIELIRKKYEKKNTTPTGFPMFDTEILTNGGFEPSRLYVFGGGSGSGKSTLLDNFIINAAVNPNPNEEKNSKFKIYLYITLENTIDESLQRIYQCLTNKGPNQAIRDISSGVDIKAYLKGLLDRNNSDIVMKYFPPTKISCIDIMMVLDDIIAQYGKDSIKGLYVDYLDLLSCDSKFDLYRIELGQITLDLKTIAVHYNIPVITATQLGRPAYRIEDSRNLNLDQVSESIKKVEHADFIGLLALDMIKENLVHMKVGKNRSGKTNISLDFTVDFNCFKFLTASKVSNSNKPDVTSEQKLSFGGLGQRNLF